MKIANYSKKLIRVISTPNQWGHLGASLIQFIINVVRYQNFSFNPNTKRYWDDRLSKFDKFWRNEHYQIISELLPKADIFSLLDIGCAIGDGCELFQQRFPNAKITGVDISNIGIAKAKEKASKVEYFVMDILKESLPKHYDYITIIETLEHFDDPFFVIDKCLKNVKKALIISVPYNAEKIGKSYSAGEHRYHFNENTFINYNTRIVKITEFIKATNDRCIVYEIIPDKRNISK